MRQHTPTIQLMAKVAVGALIVTWALSGTYALMGPWLRADVAAPGPAAPAPAGARPAAPARPVPTPTPPVLPAPRVVVVDEGVALGGEIIHWFGGRAANLAVEEFRVERTATATTLRMRIMPRNVSPPVTIWWYVNMDETFLVLPDGTWLGPRNATGVGLARWYGPDPKSARAGPRSLPDVPMHISLVFPPVSAGVAEADVLVRWWCRAEPGWQCARDAVNQRRARIVLPPLPGERPRVTPTPAPAPTPVPDGRR